MGDTSLFKPFNGWRILVKRGTMHFMPEKERSYICLGYQM